MTSSQVCVIDDLVGTVRRLYPESDVRLVDRRSAHRRSPERRFAVVPSRRRPKILVPDDAPRAAASALSRATASDRITRSVARRMMATTVRSPLRAVATRDLVTVDRLGTDSIEHHLADALDTPPGAIRLAFTIGAPRANRKPVLDVHTAYGRRLAFAKVATSTLADRLVQAETETLLRLAGAGIEHFDFPRVLHAGEWRGYRTLVLSGLAHGRGGGPAELPVAAMREVANVAGLRVGEVGRSSWLTNLRRRSAAVPGAAGQWLAELIEAYVERHGAVPLTFGAWHGDWGPWNMAWRAGCPQLWDWERFAPDVPVGLDAVHFVAHGSMRAVGRPTVARTALDVRAPDAVSQVASDLAADATAMRATVDAYLLEIGCRFVGDATDTPLVALQRVAGWYLGVVDERLRARTAAEVHP
jgi:hypothetical protein